MAARRRALAIAGAVLLAIALGWWLYQRHTHVYTEDARIGASMIDVSTRNAGQIVRFAVKQNDRLEAGTLIAQIDDRDARLELQELQARLKSTEAAIERLDAQIAMVDRESGGQFSAAKSHLDATLAALAGAQSELDYRRAEWERAQRLRANGTISERQWENARNLFNKAVQTQSRTRAESESARGSLVEAEAGQSRIRVLAQEQRGLMHDAERVRASIARQEVLIGDLRITASGSGVVDETFAHAGEYVVPGQRLILMHDPARIWVDANIKETEIRRIAPDNRVVMTVDAYPDHEFTGKVIRIGNAATSQYALLPNTNPSGNFTKVTQRLPVRISIEQHEGLLRPGMMVEVAIDAH